MDKIPENLTKLLIAIVGLLTVLVGLCNKDDIKRRVGWHDHERPHVERNFEHNQRGTR